MARLHDVGDRTDRNNGGTPRASAARDERQSIIPVRAIVLALILAMVGIWQLYSAGVFHTDKEQTDAAISADFGLCGVSGGKNCVMDGGMIQYEGRTIRISDVDIPHEVGANCAEEGVLALRASARLRDLLSAGTFSITPAPPFTADDGAELAVISRGEVSLGEKLASEGLARRWDRAAPWCATQQGPAKT